MAAAFKKKYQRNKNLLEWYDTVLIAVVTIGLFFTFCLRVIRVDGDSMNNTLLDNERVVISSFEYQPKHGDIVVVDSYIPYGRPLVKRVIGLPGDTIDIDFTQGIVYRNGEALFEPYTAEPTVTEEGVAFPLVVPEGTLFLMGDNRNHSGDSRSPKIGCVDSRDIMGKVLFRLIPFRKIGAAQ